MEQDVQLQRGLSREVLKHGLLPRLRNVARRFGERSLNLCPSALCCSNSSSPPRGITKTIQQSNATMAKVLNESYLSICLPQFMAADDDASLVKSPVLLEQKCPTMNAGNYLNSLEDDRPSTLARMSSSSTSTEEFLYEQSSQPVDDLSTQGICRMGSKAVKNDLTVNTVECAVQCETAEVNSTHQQPPGNVVKHIAPSSAQVPQLATASTQADLPLTSTGTQHGQETKELAIQATNETTSMGIQCAQDMVSATTQAGPSVQCSGVQAVVDMASSGIQAVVDTRNSSVQAVHDTKTQGTQHELVSITTSTQTEEQSQTKDTSPADLSEEIVCLVQRYIHTDSKVLNLDKFNDVEDNVRQFLQIMKNTYKESPLEPQSESHASNDATSAKLASSVQEAHQTTTTGKSPSPKAQTLQQAATTISALDMSQSDTGLTHPEGLQPEDEFSLQPLLSWPSRGRSDVEIILNEWKKEDISANGEKTKGHHEQDSSGFLVQQRCENVMEKTDPGYDQNLPTVLLNTDGIPQKQRNKDEDTVGNVAHSQHSGLPGRSELVQQIPLGLRTENIPNVNDAVNDVEGLPGSYSNSFEEITSFWQDCSSGQTTRQNIPAQRSNQSDKAALPADPPTSQGPADSYSQDDPMVIHPQSVTLVGGAESENIWEEIEEAMEGCGEPQVSYLSEEVAKAQVANSPDSHRDIPLPGTYWLTDSLSIPGFLLLNHDVPDCRSHALYLRGGIKSEGDKDRTTYNFDWEDAIDFSKTCELAPRSSANGRSEHGDLDRQNNFVLQLNHLLQQVQGTATGFTSHNQQDSKVVQVTKSSSLESFIFVSTEETNESNSCQSNTISSDGLAPSLMHVEDFLDAQDTPEAADTEDGWVNVQSVKVTQSDRQASQMKCENDTTSASRHLPSLPSELGAVGGLPVECVQPGFYQDAHGYQVPDVQVPAVMKDDIEIQLRDDGSKWVLGSGSFGTVEAAFYKSPEGPIVEVAIKRYLRENFDAVIREGKMMQFLQNTGLFPKFYGFMDIGEGSQGAICLVSELFGRGTTLADIIHGAGYCLKPFDWISICVQLAKGLRKIHQMQVIFSDLKENNVLVDITRDPVVKFIDLGISTFRQGIAYGFTAEELRPLRHIAPEVKNGGPTSILSDIWGLGILLLDIATLSGVPGLQNVAEAALAEDPQQRVCLDDIITALIVISSSRRLF